LDSLLLEEYKLIQGKIDNLGEYKFKVRSWCFTILTGGFAAIKFSGVLEDYSFSPPMLLLFLPVIGAFHLVELRQHQISKRLGFRAAAIEREWRSIGLSFERRSLTPQLANHLIQEGREENSRYSIRSRWNSFFHGLDKKLYYEDYKEPDEKVETPTHFRAAPQNKKTPRPTSLMEGLIVNAEDIFYYVQYFIVIAVVGIFSTVALLKQQPVLAQTAIVVRLNTNDFQLFVSRTNSAVTAYPTTNFQTVGVFSPNQVVTNVDVTNTMRNGEQK